MPRAPRQSAPRRSRARARGRSAQPADLADRPRHRSGRPWGEDPAAGGALRFFALRGSRSVRALRHRALRVAAFHPGRLSHQLADERAQAFAASLLMAALAYSLLAIDPLWAK